MRGIRGAITVENNDKEEIDKAVQQMLQEILVKNELQTNDIGAALFSATPDLDVSFPAAAARELSGWDMVPLFDVQQMSVEKSLAKCVRVLLLVDTDKPQSKIKHVYLGEAKKLRPDIVVK